MKNIYSLKCLVLLKNVKLRNLFLQSKYRKYKTTYTTATFLFTYSGKKNSSLLDRCYKTCNINF